MVMEKLTDNELQMISDYRMAYAYTDGANSHNQDPEDITYILREWDAQKTDLFKLLGNQLMVQKHFEYEKSYEELQEEIAGFTETRYGRAERSGALFMRQYSDYVWRVYDYGNPWDSSYKEDIAAIQKNLNRLVSDDCLISNKYDGPAFSVDMEDGKKFKILPGSKVSKTLGKLAQIFHLEGYEDFRICHSQVLNQKKLGGTMTLSIHPMDYMTMSDNECGWESCMNWMQEGGYRQGTVEMMNSPTVLVAYLASDSEMEVPYSTGKDPEEKTMWNSKKWRQLFIADPKAIAGVKDYPYHNQDLSRMAAEWIRDLALENLGWEYEDEPIAYNYGREIEVPSLKRAGEEDYDFSFNFSTDHMYNDFGSLDSHWLFIGRTITSEDVSGPSYNRYISVKYSGAAECMICGALNPDFEDDSNLACMECQDCRRCDCCGEICYDSYEVDGMRLCEYCWDNNVRDCAISGEPHMTDNMNGIYIIPHLTSKVRVDILAEHGSLEEGDSEYIYAHCDPDIWIYDEYNLKEFEERFMKEGKHLELRRMRWSREYCVYFDDLTDEAKEEFMWGYHTNGEYLDSFSVHNATASSLIED